MKEIKRYDVMNVYTPEGEENYDPMEICKNGDYVEYTDHKAVVETMQKRIEELEQEKEDYKKVLYIVEPNLEDALIDAVENILDKYE